MRVCECVLGFLLVSFNLALSGSHLSLLCLYLPPCTVRVSLSICPMGMGVMRALVHWKGIDPMGSIRWRPSTLMVTSAGSRSWLQPTGGPWLGEG